MINKKNNSKYVVFIVILVVLMIVWAGVNKLKYNQWPWQMLKEANSRYKSEKLAPSSIEESEVGKNVEGGAISKGGEGDDSTVFRQAVTRDLSSKIGELSPAEPVLGGSWFITRFWFASDKDVYIEYEDGHIMRRILIQMGYVDGELEYDVVAYFEPGENDWGLKQGEDTAFGKKLELYEYDDKEGEWVKKN